MRSAIGKYDVLSILGRGSMGVVYKARDPQIGRLVAIKTLRNVVLDEQTADEATKRFRQESRSAGCLRHPNIVTIFDTGNTDDGAPFIVMDYIHGVSFEHMIKRRAPLDPREALHYLAQVASAIDYAHRQNVIHRDVKPSNVIVDDDFRPHLLDFGVAKLSDTSLTPAGTVVGTPSYMSPEQIRGERLTAGSDLFSFGVVAFELLCRERPFRGPDFTTVVNAILQKEPKTLRAIAAERDETSILNEYHEAWTAVDRVFEKVLAKSPKERFPSALEFVDALAQPFQITVDGSGIVGGFDPRELESWFEVERVEGAVEEAQAVSIPDQADTPPEPSTEPRASDTVVSNVAIHVPSAGVSQGRKVSAAVGVIASLIVLGVAAVWIDVGDTPSERVSLASKSRTSTTRTDAPIAIRLPEGVRSQAFFDGLTPAELRAVVQEHQASLSDEEMRSLIRSIVSRRSERLIDLVQSMQDHKNPLVRIEVIKALGSSTFRALQSSESTLVARLADGDFLVRGYAAKLLGESGGNLAQAALQAQLEKESDSRVRTVIEKALGDKVKTSDADALRIN